MPTAKTTKPAANTKAAAPKKVTKGTKIGIVESDKRSTTRTVVISYSAKHPKYGKYVRAKTVLQIHDPKNDSKLGDKVEIAPCRPISKSKTWELVKVVERRGELTAALASAKAISE